MKRTTDIHNLQRRKLSTASCLAITLLITACGGESFSRDDAIDRVRTDLGFSEKEATCAVDNIGRELGTFDALGDPEVATDEDAAVMGDILLACVETTLARASNDKEPEEFESASAAAPAEDPAVPDDTISAPADPGVASVAGDWTAAQLCTLLNGADVSAAFGAAAVATPAEQFEDPTRSICVWVDPDSAETIPPSLVLADQEPAPGPLYIDGTPVDIAGAEEVDYRPEWLPGEDFLVLTAGDQQLTLRYQSGAPAALDLMVAAATEWAAVQSG